MLQAGDEKRPAVGAMGVPLDLLFFRVRKRPSDGLLEALQIQVGLLRQQSIDGTAELDELVDGPFAIRPSPSIDSPMMPTNQARLFLALA